MEKLLDHLTHRTAGALAFGALVAVAIVSWAASTAVWPGLVILLLAVVYGFAVATGGPPLENLVDTTKRLVPVLRDISAPPTAEESSPIIVVSGPPPPSDIDRAGDPSTDPEVLMDLAARRPDLRPVIANNPSAYPALLDWLAALNDPQTNEALARRHS